MTLFECYVNQSVSILVCHTKTEEDKTKT